MNLRAYIRSNRTFILDELMQASSSMSVSAPSENQTSYENTTFDPKMCESISKDMLHYIEEGVLRNGSANNNAKKLSVAYIGYLSMMLRQIVHTDILQKQILIEGIPETLDTAIENFTCEYSKRKNQSKMKKISAANTDDVEINEDAVQSERLAVIGQLAAGVAHEIGNPLTSISSVVQILKRKISDPFVVEQLNNIKVSIDRIARIVHELVDFSRPAPFNPSLGNINNVIKTAIGMMRYDHRVKNVNIETSLSDSLPEIILVPDQLLQVFVNLMINAVDAMTGNGQITIHTWQDGHYVNASIVDTGRGIPKILIPKIFDPFFTTKKVGEGTGLGLSVSYGIINKHNGKIEVQSIVGEGSIFTVRLPIHSHQ